MKNALIPAVRGMRDILPDEIGAWQHLEHTAAACFARYGYRELRTPLLERLDLFSRQLGESTDVVQKEMYRFTDAANGEELALRPEATVSTVRALLAAGAQRSGGTRVWYGGAMFRRERPQKGRYRQFHQLGAEALGTADAALDAEQILMLARLWREMGISDKLQLQINNLGNAAERARHREQLTQYFSRHREELDEAAQARLHTNPLRILDSKDERTLAIAAEAPALAAELGDDSRRYVDAVREKLAAAGVAFCDNPALVRGLDYYNLTVYEWCVADDERRQNAVAGGGRYDGLAEQIGGAALPGCGFALGMERVLELLPPDAAARGCAECFLAIAAGGEAERIAETVAERCRDDGLTVWRHSGGGNLSRQLKKADALGAVLAIIVGEDECAGGYITIKRLTDGTQQQVATADAAQISRRMLNA